MFKIIFLCIIFISFSKGDNTSLQINSVKTNYINSSGELKDITIEREIDPLCKNIHITNEMFWQGKYASNDVPEVCKSTFITSAGKTIYPMQIHRGVETYGEVEVMAFIKKMQEDKSMLFIDTRDEEWYEYRTIPGAINIHYVYLMMPKVFEEEYKVSLAKLGIIGNEKPYDFSHAKTILLFCNGAWCSQSPKMVKALLTLGYPTEKIKWYRGGMQTWLSAGMTSTRKNKFSRQ